jgi:hypothetical protein
MKQRFSEEQMVSILRAAETGATTAKDICRKHEIFRADRLSMEVEVWWHGRVRCPAAEAVGGGERQAQTDAGRAAVGSGRALRRSPRENADPGGTTPCRC